MNAAFGFHRRLAIGTTTLVLALALGLLCLAPADASGGVTAEPPTERIVGALRTEAPAMRGMIVAPLESSRHDVDPSTTVGDANVADRSAVAAPSPTSTLRVHSLDPTPGRPVTVLWSIDRATRRALESVHVTDAAGDAHFAIAADATRDSVFVDYAFPTLGSAVSPLPLASPSPEIRIELPALELGWLALEFVDRQGRPSNAVQQLGLRVHHVAIGPADRRHEFRVIDSRLVLPIEAVGLELDLQILAGAHFASFEPTRITGPDQAGTTRRHQIVIDSPEPMSDSAPDLAERRVSGTVRDAFARPRSDIAVLLERERIVYSVKSEPRSVWNVIGTAHSGASGHFELRGASDPIGRLRVRADPSKGYRSDAMIVTDDRTPIELIVPTARGLLRGAH